MCHVIVLYVSVTNTKANATLVTEHNFSGYVLFNLFLSVFHVVSSLFRVFLWFEIHFITERTKDKMECYTVTENISKILFLWNKKQVVDNFWNKFVEIKHDIIEFDRNRCKSWETQFTGIYLGFHLKNHCLKWFSKELCPRPFSQFSRETFLDIFIL